jgi:hypothetical protein
LADTAKKSLIFFIKIFAGMKKRSIFALAIKHWFGSSVG